MDRAGDTVPHTVVTTETFPSWSPALIAIVSPRCKPNPAFIHIVSSLTEHSLAFFVQSLLYWFARAAVIKYHRLSSLKNRNVLAHSSGDCHARLRYGLSLGCVPGLSPWLLGDHLLFMLSFVYAFFCVQLSPFHKDTSHIGLEPTLMTSL